MRKRINILSSALIFLACSVSAETLSISEEEERMILQLGMGASNIGKPVCDGKGIPDGWIIVDKATTMICGISGVDSPAGFSKVVPIIAQYSNKKAGTVMEVCYGAVPKGWKKISEGHSSSLCGGSPFDFPLTSGSLNVMKIKKKKIKK